MRKLFIILIITFSSVNAQEKMKINESTKKYEMIYELDFSGKNVNNLFSDVNEWLAINYNVEGSGLKFSDEKKGKMIFNGAIIRKASVGDSVISFTMTFLFNGSKINCNITNFVIEHRNGHTQMRGRTYEYERKDLMGMKKIFKFTEEGIDKDINNLMSTLNK
jgi:hypothetical protein